MVGNLLNFPNENEYWAYLEVRRRIRKALRGPHYIEGDPLIKTLEVRLHGDDIKLDPRHITPDIQPLAMHYLSGTPLLIEVYGLTTEKPQYKDRLLLILNGPQGIELYINDAINRYFDAMQSSGWERAVRNDVFYPLKDLGLSIRIEDWEFHGAINRETEWEKMTQMKIVFRW